MNTFSTEYTSCVVCGSSEGRVEAYGADYIYESSPQISTAWRCGGCGHVYLNPRPTMEAVSVIYPQNYASFSGKFTQTSSRLSQIKEYVQLRRIKCLLEKLPENAKYLDIGCGDGQLLEAIKRNFPLVEVHGLDWKFSQEVCDRLNAHNIIVHESLLEQADFPDSYFDLVTMNQLIEHLWDPRKCLVMVCSILSPLGRLTLATPNVQGYDRRFFPTGGWGGYYFPRHLNLFDRPLLVRLLAECGLETIKSRYLVAPVIWCYSFMALTKCRFPSFHWLHRCLDVHNLPLMAVFTAIDMLAIILGIPTSNQEVVVQRRVNKMAKIDSKSPSVPF